MQNSTVKNSTNIWSHLIAFSFTHVPYKIHLSYSREISRSLVQIENLTSLDQILVILDMYNEIDS
jgi:hypothetical protein